MRTYVVVELEVDGEVLQDLINVLERVVPYMADNVTVSVPQAETDNQGGIVLYVGAS